MSDFDKSYFNQKGVLTKSFTRASGFLSEDELLRKSLSETRKQEAQDVENKEVQVLMGQGSAETPNVLPGGIQSKYGYVLKKKSVDKENADFWFDVLFQQAIDLAIAQMQERLAYHQAQMNLYAEAIRKGMETLDDLNSKISALETLRTDFEERGKFERDEQGDLKNKDAKAALKEWERKTGRAIDLDDPASYFIILEILKSLETQKRETARQIEHDKAAYETHKVKRDEVKEILNELESGDRARQEQALEEIDTFDMYLKRNVENKIIQKAEHLQQADNASMRQDVIADDLEMDDFDLGFPDIQNQFEAAAKTGQGRTPIKDTPQNTDKQTPQKPRLSFGTISSL